MTPLTKKEEKMHNKQKVKGLLCMQKKFSSDDNNKNYQKVRDHCHYTTR